MDPLTQLNNHLDRWALPRLRGWTRQDWMVYVRQNYFLREGHPNRYQVLGDISVVFARDPGNEQYFKEYSELVVKNMNEGEDNLLWAMADAIEVLFDRWYPVVLRCWGTAGSVGSEYAPSTEFYLQDNFTDSVIFLRKIHAPMA